MKVTNDVHRTHVILQPMLAAAAGVASKHAQDGITDAPPGIGGRSRRIDAGRGTKQGSRILVSDPEAAAIHAFTVRASLVSRTAYGAMQ